MNLQSWNFDTNAQNEALINELKGALFEYLVAETLAKHNQCHNRVAPDLRDRLLHYESWLRNHDLELIKFLPKAAEELSKSLCRHLPAKILGVESIGKIAGGSGQKELFESDLVVHGQNETLGVEDSFIGLKLCKTNSYVNTKSGGAKTFLAKYFCDLDSAIEYQEKLGHTIDQGFFVMGQKLYEEAGLVAQGINFQGKFGEEWQEQNSSLPGQLPPELRAIVLQYYQTVIQAIYQRMQDWIERSKEQFCNALYPLLGFGAKNLIQAMAFVETKSVNGKKNYHLSEQRINTAQDVAQELSLVKLSPLQLELSSFEIILNSWRVQIRVKPMNKFTVPGLKVNCSVKYPRNF